MNKLKISQVQFQASHVPALNAKIIEKSFVINDLWEQGRIFSLTLLVGSSCVGFLSALISGSIIFFIYKIKTKR